MYYSAFNLPYLVSTESDGFIADEQLEYWERTLQEETAELARTAADAYVVATDMGIESSTALGILSFHKDYKLNMISEDDNEVTLQVAGQTASVSKDPTTVRMFRTSIQGFGPNLDADRAILLRARLQILYLFYKIEYRKVAISTHLPPEQIGSWLNSYYDEILDCWPSTSICIGEKTYDLGIPLAQKIPGDNHIWLCLVVF